MEKAKSKTEIRHEKILDMLEGSDTVKLGVFCEQLGCSESTIRNDLAYLEGEKKLRRVFGGAVKADVSPYDLINLADRETIYLAEKQRIAKYVADNMLRDNQTIILDAGTTNSQIAKIIAERDMNMIVLTASMTIGQILSRAENVTLYLFGGFYYPDRGFFYDSNIDQLMKMIRADIYFLSVNGISLESQFTITGQDETKIKSLLMDIAGRTVVVADRSKLGRNAMKIVADFDSVDLLVTDDKADPGFVQKLRQRGIDVVLA